jgi:Uma2 family endonuclease
MTVDTRVFTADELLQLPDDGWRYELVEGELRKMAPAGYEHGLIANRISARLFTYVEQHRLGQVPAAETGFTISRNPDTVLAPDVAFVRAERAADTRGFFAGAPDVAIEVVSPSDRYTEVAAKTRTYLRAGTLAVVIVDPEARIVEVHRPSGRTDVSDVLTLEDVIPGWSMTLEDIFTTAR